MSFGSAFLETFEAFVFPAEVGIFFFRNLENISPPISVPKAQAVGQFLRNIQNFSTSAVMIEANIRKTLILLLC
jgi:hypothetical protein